MTFSQSDGESVSRRVRRATSRFGSGSCARTATYRFDASYATFTSVANVGAAPSFGSRWWKSLTAGTCSQTASVNAPPSLIAVASGSGVAAMVAVPADGAADPDSVADSSRKTSEVFSIEPNS